MTPDPEPDHRGGWLLTRGHPLARAAVRRAIDSGRPPHALLLVGPRGVGKTTLALDLAAGLACTAIDPATRPCRSCAGCRKVAHGNHPDVHRITPEGAGEQIRLPQVQALIGELALLPMEAPVRVAIIESADRLNPDAQNALLKTLEEPVGAACIVLCADDPATILPTVASRSARARLGPVPTAEIAALVVAHTALDAVRARAVAAAADGAPGVALALARSPDALLIRDRIARQLVDLVGADRRTRLEASATLMIDGAALEEALAAPAEAPVDPAPPTRRSSTTRAPKATSARPSRRPEPAERRRAARRVLAIWRDVARDVGMRVGDARAAVRGVDLLEELDAAAGMPLPALTSFLDRLDGSTAALEAYASPELLLDGLLLAWPRPAPGTRT
ncbi:MAG: hypothetical protein KF809_00235 [Chloroflexi bacterium]|nr:hypothetical protein [Chloroflexota bacterium]